MKQLSDNLLKEITRRLANSIQPERIYLFGSHAAGCAEPDSDIDLLAVVGGDDKSTHDLARKGRASLWGLQIPVDLIVCTKAQFKRYSHVKNTVINEAICEGRLIYGT